MLGQWRRRVGRRWPWSADNHSMGYLSLLRKLPALLLPALLLACSPLPRFARPQMDFSTGWRSDRSGVPYRKLRIADFKAPALPANLRRYRHHIQARSCLDIHPAPGFLLAINSNAIDGRRVYLGTFRHIALEAAFFPSCSWWNPRIPASRRAYVLEHEQIHFALSELTARRATRTAREQLHGLLVFGNSVAEVKDKLMKRVRDLVHGAMRSDLQEQTAFDEDTSATFDPVAQRSWRVKVERRLGTGNPSPSAPPSPRTSHPSPSRTSRTFSAMALEEKGF